MAANCYSKCVKHNVNFKWTINDFITCREVCMAHSSIHLVSAFFNSSLKSSWRLQLLFNDPQYISISLHYSRRLWSKNQPEKIVTARTDLFISGVEKTQLFQSFNNSVHCFSNDPNFSENAKKSLDRIFMSTSKMNELPEELLHNSLTICCDLTEFEGPELYRTWFDVIPSNITTDLKKLYESKVNTDFVFVVDEEEFQVHKTILVARSPVFAAMFAHETTEQKDNRTTITDINAKTFELLLEFLYTDNVSDIDENAMDLLVAANKYQLDRLHTICQKEISKSITADNAVAIMAYANRENSQWLVDAATNFILNHKKEVAKTPGFKELGKNDFDSIIKLFETNVSI